MPCSDKPSHLGAEYAQQFCDPSVAAAYAARPPYPGAVFALLASLITESPRAVLELGAGTGDITFRLAQHVDRIDAIEPSAAMRDAASPRLEASVSNIRWFAQTAETFAPQGAYPLIVAAESLHWMDWGTVLPKLSQHLSPRGVLAIVTVRTLPDVSWTSELRSLISRHSTNRDYVAYDIVEEIRKRGLFTEIGRQTVSTPAFTQGVSRYIESFHSRNGFSRDRMAPDAVAKFADELRSLLSRHGVHDGLTSRVETTVIWGRPHTPR